jgi:trigger factor
MRVEVDVQAVEKAFEQMVTEFQRQAKLPGFRPGKAPRDQVAKIFAKQIEQEAKKKLISDSYKQAVKEQKLAVVSNSDVEEIQFGRNVPLQFAVTLDTAPDFELPEYRGLFVRVPRAVVSLADLDRALTVLREKRASYLDIDRPAKYGDILVLNYVGRCQGKPIKEMETTVKGLAAQKNYWLRLGQEGFLPGFSEQLLGTQPGDRRTVTVEFPANFDEAVLAGKHGVYEVEILQIKEQLLPELNDEFAQAYGAENMDVLREGVRRDLQNDLNYKQNVSIRNQIVRSLLDRVNFDLPESAVLAETKNVVLDIVRENTERGIDMGTIDAQKDEIYSFASANAKERVKLTFLIERIAAKEGIRATEEEINEHIVLLAHQSNIKVDKFVKQLKERNGIAEIHNRIIYSKVIDFLQLHARVEEDALA